ncbi:MAG: formyltransferase family protein [Longimicrobiaceae bacterium]
MTSTAGGEARSGQVRPLHVVVLTSIGIGIDVALALRGSPAVGRLTLMTAPLRSVRPPLSRKLREMHRLRGTPGLLAAAAGRLRRPRLEPEGDRLRRLTCELLPGVTHLHVRDFHEPHARCQLAELAPDLGVVVATGLLKSEVFSVPRLGCVNLHLGKAPDYRGSSPGFWEMYHGETEVGVTVHRVTETLDGGDILLQKCYPLDPAPPGDPLRYLKRYVSEVLLANGRQIVRAAVEQIAAGTEEARPQDGSRARTFRRAPYAAQRELRRRVKQRRRW